MSVDLKNHFSITSSHEVQQICYEPLNSIGVTYFNYIKIYHDGSRELLTNNSVWIDHFYKNSLYKSVGVIDIEYLLPKGYFLWSELKSDDPAYAQGRESFNIDNGLTFVIKKNTETVLYIFASTREQYTINNFYVRNIDLFKRFILYFNDKGGELLKKSSENKIYLPEKQIISNINLNYININDQVRNEFFQKTDMKRYFLLDREDNMYLTKKEAECVAYMIEGSTAKQIAKKLNISFRTVETHLRKIKEKLNCGNKEELSRLIIDSGIYSVILPKKQKEQNESIIN